MGRLHKSISTIIVLIFITILAACSAEPAMKTIATATPTPSIATMPTTPSPAPTVGITATASPTPTPIPSPTPLTYDQKLMQKYVDELADCQPELKEFCAPSEGVNASSNTLGIFALNCGKDDLANTKEYPSFVPVIRRLLVIESFAVAMDRLGGEYGLSQTADTGNRGGYIKQMLCYNNCLFLYNKTKDKFWKDLADGCKISAEGFAKQYGLLSDDPSLIQLIKNVEDNNWVKPFGADNWQEIGAVLSNK